MRDNARHQAMADTPVVEETRRSDAQSEFLRGQLRHWLEQVHAAGRTPELFELEMWLRSFERFFRIRNQPLSEKEARQLALRNWSEELRLVDNVILRVMPHSFRNCLSKVVARNFACSGVIRF